MEHANDDYIRVCEDAVRAAGAVLQRLRGRVTVSEKGPADLVTEADLAAQRAVREIVLAAFPEHDFLGEEEEGETGTEADRTGEGRRPADSDCRWIVDPLDGTTNYVHGVPHYAVSLALERRGEVLAGAVLDPTLDECFTATAGGGARLNGQPIRVSAVTELSRALAVAGFPPGVTADSPDLRLFLEVVSRCQSVRRTGSAALNFCYLAAGRFDLYWSFSTRIWDVAAGSLILREAGGVITAPDGSPFRVEEARFLAAANERLRGELEALWNVNEVLQAQLDALSAGIARR
jgi:myo-inositol-1(or 4)-monophosphatase